MLKHTSFFLRPPAWIICGLIILVMNGCDSGNNSDNTITLQAEVSQDMNGKDVSFKFSSDSFPTGRLEDVSCECNIDLESFLDSRGFTRADLLSAKLKSARLVMLFPVSERLDFLNQAILKFEADGVSVTEVANQGSFPTNREADLSVLANRDITSFLSRSNFDAILQIDAKQLLPAEDYEMALVMDIEMQVKGP